MSAPPAPPPRPAAPAAPTTAPTAAPSAAERAWALAIALTLRLEGGFQCDASDPGNARGGATNLGITRDTLAASRGVPPERVTRDMVRALTREEASRIYARDYWVPSGAERCAAAGRAGLALAQMDWAVNGGEGRARYYLQAALNVVRATAGAGASAGHGRPLPPLAVDGHLGPRTWGAVDALTPAEESAAVAAHLRLRLLHYRLRAALGTPDEQADMRAQLAAAGLPERLWPTPHAAERAWYRTWVQRLRAVAAAAGLAPPADPA